MLRPLWKPWEEKALPSTESRDTAACRLNMVSASIGLAVWSSQSEKLASMCLADVDRKQQSLARLACSMAIMDTLAGAIGVFLCAPDQCRAMGAA